MLQLSYFWYIITILITKFVLILSVFNFFRLLREPIMSNNLNTDKRIWVLKEYWKSQNSETVKRK